MRMNPYRQRLTVNGTSHRERMIHAAQDFANRHAPESISYKEIKIDGQPEHALIISTSAVSEKIIRMLPGHDFLVGQIVEWRDSYWLITEKDNDDDVTTRGRIEQCNRQLTWQNPNTGEIVSRWCTARKPYYSNLDEDPKIITSSREFKVQLPYDEETSLLKLDKRFMMEVVAGEPKTYKIVSIDTITERFSREDSITGFLVLNIEQDEYSAVRDNVDLGVCDYFVLENPVLPVEKPDAKTPDSEIIYKGAATIKLGGSAKTFTFTEKGADRYDAVVWFCEIPPEHADFIHLEGNANCARLYADDNAVLEGIHFTLSAKDEQTGAAASLLLEVTA